MYNIYLEDWDIDCINKVAQTFDEVFRGIHLQLQYLQGNNPEEIQQLQNTGFLTPPQ